MFLNLAPPRHTRPPLPLLQSMINRTGTSTCSPLSAIGRPAIVRSSQVAFDMLQSSIPPSPRRRSDNAPTSSFLNTSCNRCGTTQLPFACIIETATTEPFSGRECFFWNKEHVIFIILLFIVVRKYVCEFLCICSCFLQLFNILELICFTCVVPHRLSN